MEIVEYNIIVHKIMLEVGVRSMDDKNCLRLDKQICFPLYAASRKVTKLYGPLLKPLGLTYTQYLLMLVLWEEDDLTVGEICKRLRLDSGTITPVIKKMEKEGLVHRERSEQDSRVVVVKLNEKGKKLEEKARDIPKKIYSCVDLPEDKLKMLYEILYEFLDEE